MKLHSASFLLAIAVLAASCGEKDDVVSDDSPDDSVVTTDDSEATYLDEDGDGVSPDDGDCDDADAEVYPGRTEECNGVDDNCNDLVDEGFEDTDEDDTADCVDSEECDGLDNDGDGETDEDFADNDGDGVADCVGTETCDGLDNDADGLIDEGYDLDGDGYTQCEDDCDDDNADAYPGNTEQDGDGADNDCDGLTDEGSYESGSLVITEIMLNPASVADPDGEWFEVYNASGGVFCFDGLTITSGDGESHQILPDESLCAPAGAFVVFGANDNSATNGGVDVDYEYDDISLSNESDELTLSAEDTILDTVSWDDGATFPDPDGASLMIDPGYYDSELNDDAVYWCAATDEWATASDKGSPGEENELCSTYDHDGDGYSGDEGDCDDADPDIYPTAPEKDADKDNDCDGDIEAMPVAVASYDSASSSLLHCDVLYLDGSASADPDGSSLTYSWELTSAPASSALTTSDLSDSSAQNPEFTPDADGEYIFTLTVNDGGADSLPSALTLTIAEQTSNTPPVADAGADSSSSATAECQSYSYGAYYVCQDCADEDFELDGTGSGDANSDDHMTYSWSTSSSYASIDDSTSSAPTLTLSGVAPPDYADTTTETVEVTLTVTDCYGDTDTDTVTVTFDCTGE